MQKLDLTQKQLNTLQKKNISTKEQLIRFSPRKYHDCREIQYVDSQFNDELTTLILRLKKMTTSKMGNGAKMMTAYMFDTRTGRDIRITWFQTDYLYKLFSDCIGEEFFVYGKLTFNNQYGFQMTNPIYFTKDLFSYRRLNPVYRKFSGITEDNFQKQVDDSILSYLEEPFTEEFKIDYRFLSDTEAGRRIHYPENIKDIEDGNRHFNIQDLIYFALHMQKRITNASGNAMDIQKSTLMDSIKESLPFALTEGQNEVVEKIKEKLMNKEPVNALVQGDVSCGKTITAFLLLFLAIENGYQATLLAPTAVLASQHYEDLKKIAEPLSINVSFLNSSLTKKEKESILKKTETGEIQILVGTHAISQPNVIFKNLGMIIIDEEQRFGVEQRERLKEKTKLAPAYISMTATPIPRTLANAIYGEGTQTFSIKSMPNGRKPVSTSIETSFDVPEILREELKNGRQAYVICPLIEESDEDSLMKNCRSVKETKEFYEKELGEEYKVAELTGKMKESEMLSVLKDFTDGKIAVLVSTTVVEVGVNNPNASVIVIQNAERFGLSSLHQLRGRVRRGSYAPYCILVSESNDNERLKAMCTTEDGFKLSEMDLEIRQSGNLIGISQSGFNKHVELIKSNPSLYEYAKIIAKELTKRKEDERFLEAMKSIYEGI